MKKLEAGSIDMVLADLPYGTTACKWDSVIPFEPLWAELNRVAKPSAAMVMFGSEPFSTALRASNLKAFKYDWVWNKGFGSNPMQAKRQPLRFHEVISVFSPGNVTYIPQLMQKQRVRKASKYDTGSARYLGSDARALTEPKQAEYTHDYPKSIIECSSRADPDRGLHPTQKPTALLEYLIKTYTLEGDTVLDPTMGSGSTGVACRNLGRKFVGIERDEKYFAIASQRIAQTHQQMHM